MFFNHMGWREKENSMFFFQLIECKFYENLVYPEYAEYIIRMYNPASKYFTNDSFCNRRFCWNLNAGLN